MIANSSTFHTHPESHRDLFCLSHALIQHASTSLAIIFGRVDSGIIWFLRNGANAASVSVQALSAVQALMLAVIALKHPAKECWTLCVLRGMNGVNNP